jgi:hypothetical protein
MIYIDHISSFEQFGMHFEIFRLWNEREHIDSLYLVAIQLVKKEDYYKIGKALEIAVLLIFKYTTPIDKGIAVKESILRKLST